MFSTGLTRRLGGVACLVAVSLFAQPALAQADGRGSQYRESRSGAFAGAAFRVELGGRAKPASARLQLGTRSLAGDRQSAAPFDSRQVPALELGLGGKERGHLFIAGQPKAEMARRLGINSGAGETLMIIFGATLLVVGVYVIVNLDGLSTDD